MRKSIFAVGDTLEATFEIRELLSENEMGQTYAARDRRFGREVAIKVLWPELGVEALRSEARALAAFHHPGLVTAHRFGVHGTSEFLVVERLYGITLQTHLARRSRGGGLSVTEIVEILLGIADALGAIHAHGLVHRDLGTDVVDLEPGGRVVLAAFGVVSHERATIDRAARRTARDDRSYRERLADAQALDVVALGWIAVELTAAVTGEVPAALAHLIDDLTSGRARRVETVGGLLRSLRPATSEPVTGPAPATTGADASTVVGGRYELERRLGEGGMGQVFVARHLQLGKRFALKIISPTFAGDAEARARFNDEALLASEITHPNIVSVVDFGDDPQVGAYMVMELLTGVGLAEAAIDKLPLHRACEILAQIADALEFIHRKGIVHGDVKDANIMLVEEATAGSRRKRVARLLDFGLAHRISATPRALQEVVSGTPHYVAPERVRGAPASVATDVYALGVLGYLLLTGTLPFEGSTEEVLAAHVAEAPEALTTRRGEPVDPALEALILRAIAKDVATRHATAAAFLYELRTVMDMLGLGTRRARLAPDREGPLGSVFTRSRIAQAVVSLDGDIAFANQAFHQLLGADGAAEPPDLARLSALVPDVLATIRRVHAEAFPAQCGGRLDTSRLVCWAAPVRAAAQQVHLMVRLEPAT